MDLQVENVAKSWGEIQVLYDLNFSLGENEILCILGPSGCGKTTILNLISGIIRPDAGSVRFSCEGKTGYVFQEPRLLPWKTVYDNIAFVLKHWMSQDELDKTVKGYIEMMELNQFKDAYPRQLSGGMKQRVSLARAFAYNPDLLLMDEPFKSLDLTLRFSLIKLLLKLWRSQPKSIVFVTHEVSEAILLGDRVCVLSSKPTYVKDCISIDIHQEEREISDPRLLMIEGKLYKLLAEE